MVEEGEGVVMHASNGESVMMGRMEGIDLSLPITSTYLRRMRGLSSEPKEGEDSNTGDEDPGQGEKPPQVSWPAFPALGVQRMSPMNQAAPASQLGQLLVQNGSTNARPMSPGRSDLSRDDSNLGDDTSSIGAKEDLDEEDENDEDLEDNSGDPERLKAFNMFVRLFVDENLDRHVPISKQPKEKIQAIIDSCTRQFPEYSERARKRIRTYLKSCRRTKRSREQAGLDTSNG